jgi:hypothetical protein
MELIFIITLLIVHLVFFIIILIEMEKQNQRELMLTCAVLWCCIGSTIAYFWGWFKYPKKGILVAWTIFQLIVFFLFYEE